MQVQTSVEVFGYESTCSEYIRIKELVILLGVSRSTIYDWLDEKSTAMTAPKIKIGASAVQFSLIDIEGGLKLKT